MECRQTPDGLTVLDDCYNAGPESMEAALNMLKQMTWVYQRPGVAIVPQGRVQHGNLIGHGQLVEDRELIAYALQPIGRLALQRRAQL